MAFVKNRASLIYKLAMCALNIGSQHAIETIINASEVLEKIDMKHLLDCQIIVNTMHCAPLQICSCVPQFENRCPRPIT